MKIKESLLTKYMKMILGIPGQLDEYRKQEMQRICNNAFVITWLYIVTATMFFMLYGYLHPFNGIMMFSMSNVIFLFFVSVYMKLAARKSHLTKEEVSIEDYNKAKKKILLLSIKDFILFVVIFNLLDAILNFVFDNDNILNQIIHPKKGFTILIFFGTFVAIGNYISRLHRMKKMK
ncbi:DUF3278 domain-containing protein [Apilactobacillus micheneri]|nr:DUF3278 domain-containing protein [Apilactobacillus micheneri]